MNAESENFEALRKLMALKRYEQPPPGYFNNLSGRIIVRLETLEPTFWEKLSQSFVLRPAMAYALGLAFCGAFASGLVYSLQPRSDQAALQRNPASPWDTDALSTRMASQTGANYLPTLHVRGYDNFVTTNEPQPKPSLFQPFEIRAATVNYQLGN